MNTNSGAKIDNDNALPLALVRKFGGWATRAQNYPTFSPTWFRYRLFSFMVPIVLYAIFILCSALGATDMLSTPVPGGFYYEACRSWLTVVIFLLLGRWLAMQIWKRRWSPRKEAIGIVLALLLGSLLAKELDHLPADSFSFNAKESKPDTKMQAKAETSEHVAARSQVIAKDDNGNLRSYQAPRATVIIGELLWVLLFFWLGGGLDLVQYFRQRSAFKDALMQQELESARASRNEAEMRLSVLAGQIEPHFLFNTLAGVRSAFVSDPTRGIAIIDHLVDYLRATIPQMRNDANSAQVLLGSQLDAVRAYLGVMHARLPRLNFSVNCDPALVDQPVPPLMLISLVENAVKHGIEPKPGPARIDVLARKVEHAGGARIELIVSDDGVGFSGVTSGSGIGLANIRERLIQLFGSQAELVLKARTEGGVIASVSFPAHS
jgi:hypothetical protein